MAISPTTPATGFGAPAGFATSMYSDFLGRNPTAEEAAPWDGSQGHTASTLFGQLANSQEARNFAVNNDYSALLGRPADAAGLAFYSDPANYGSAWDSLQNSDEGRSYGVSQLYANNLGRAPDKAGLDYWSQAANFGSAINGGIANSPEALAHAASVPALDSIDRSANPYGDYSSAYQKWIDAQNNPSQNWSDPEKKLTSVYDIPQLTPAEQLAVARTIWGESKGEGANGQLAVANVIRNRQAQQVQPGMASFGTHIGGGDAGDILRVNQFNGANDKTFNPNSAQGKAILDMVQQVWAGQASDPSQGSTFYLNPVTTKNHQPWQDVLAQQRAPFKVGNHEFYGVVDPSVYSNGAGYSLPDWYPSNLQPLNTDTITGRPTDTQDTGTPAGQVNVATLNRGTMTDATTTPTIPNGINTSAIQQLLDGLAKSPDDLTRGSDLSTMFNSSTANSLQQLLNQNNISFQSFMNSLNGGANSSTLMQMLLSGGGTAPGIGNTTGISLLGGNSPNGTDGIYLAPSGTFGPGP